MAVDGFGAGDMPATLAARLREAGAGFRIYRPLRGFRRRARHLRRLHRKLAVIDGRIGFVGGINIIDDHNHGPMDDAGLGPRYDFAVAVEGPLVDQIALTTERLWWQLSLRDEMQMIGPARRRRVPAAHRPAAGPAPDSAGSMRAALLLRDNLRNRRAIERAYLQALGAARRDVVLANAYFLPGHKLRRALLSCRRRGVRACGCCCRAGWNTACSTTPPMRCTRRCWRRAWRSTSTTTASCTKVAVVDDTRATVGSSNMDPFSLLLAREANVAVYDAGFCAGLRAELEHAISQRSVPVRADAHAGARRCAGWSTGLPTGAPARCHDRRRDRPLLSLAALPHAPPQALARQSCRPCCGALRLETVI